MVLTSDARTQGVRLFGIFPSRANRIDARLVSHERKKVCTLEVSCPWIESRAKEDEEKTLKYGPMMWELKQRNHGYRVE